jgi:hypothetical protein
MDRAADVAVDPQGLDVGRYIAVTLGVERLARAGPAATAIVSCGVNCVGNAFRANASKMNPG